MAKKSSSADFDEDMSGIMFDGEKIDIPKMDMIFYAVYKKGISSRDGLKDELLFEIEKAGLNPPKGKEDDFGYALVKKYKMTMERGSSMDFY
ncbi:hypothetical protein L1994_10245 [Methanomicrobium antiquum]|uniref:Uncharacterized protein n=1 Tax=Methanomicrobium antiquum TaxID=487686 RepID=A0AAF0JTM1_9EURY|nr:hypothetical protein [Methanomicrobium antiquum]MDD3976721.1 hypothetical protein [Methanomicrobium sp.]WFN36508.1 hypothetical protein L1994_10245 [Methanomicrobium antiquum]